MPGLVKQMFDAHLDRMNEVSPEFADTLLESGKQIHLAKRLNFGNAVPAKGWDSLAAKHAAAVAGVVSPGEVDAILDRDAIARSNLPTRVVGDRTRKPESSWVNEAAKNAARVHGIVNPNDVDKMLDRRRIEDSLGKPCAASCCPCATAMRCPTSRLTSRCLWQQQVGRQESLAQATPRPAGSMRQLRTAPPSSALSILTR